MNFLAHFIIAMRFLTPIKPLSAYVVGTVLPDLLPLAADQVRFRPGQFSAGTEFEAALAAGVSVHLATDAVFHKTNAFAEASAEVSGLLAETAFEGVRVRRFFVAHVLTELVLDAVLVREDPAIADGFYEAFAAADLGLVTQWTEKVTAKSLPHLAHVLERFAGSQYLRQYAEDDGVATGLSNTCRRARQDTFEGENFRRLSAVVTKAASELPKFVPALLAETAAGITRTNGENAGITKQE